MYIHTYDRLYSIYIYINTYTLTCSTFMYAQILLSLPNAKLDTTHSHNIRHIHTLHATNQQVRPSTGLSSPSLTILNHSSFASPFSLAKKPRYEHFLDWTLWPMSLRSGAVYDSRSSYNKVIINNSLSDYLSNYLLICLLRTFWSASIYYDQWVLLLMIASYCSIDQYHWTLISICTCTF